MDAVRRAILLTPSQRHSLSSCGLGVCEQIVQMASSGIDYGSAPDYEKTVAVDSEKVAVPGNYRRASITTSVKTSRDATHRKLKPRHIQLIGIGGTIGTALYVQIGRGLMNGGPASLFLAFSIWYVRLCTSQVVHVNTRLIFSGVHSFSPLRYVRDPSNARYPSAKPLLELFPCNVPSRSKLQR